MAIAAKHKAYAQGDDELIRLYLSDISQRDLLTREDEVRLAKAVELGNEAQAELSRTGDTLTRRRYRALSRVADEGIKAQIIFVESNLRLVVSIAKKFQASGLPLLDLIQEGNLGLIHAVEKFDWRKGFKFSTYATWWIRQYIARGVAHTSRTIRLPVHARDMLERVKHAKFRLQLKLGRKATLQELVDEVGVSEDKIVDALRYQLEPVSLSDTIFQDNNVKLVDLVEDKNMSSPFDVAAKSIIPHEVERMLSILDERERKILILRYGLGDDEPYTLEQIADVFNLTRERIRQIEARAMSKLRHPSAAIGARDLIRH